jgi:hypothetical protein
MAAKSATNAGENTGARGKLKNADRSISDDLELLRIIIQESPSLRNVVMDRLQQAKARIDKEAKSPGAKLAANKSK